MSELAVNSIVDASSGNTVQINGQTPSESNMQGRNRIINGDMRIAQRGTAAVTGTGDFPVDRFVMGRSTGGASGQQDSSAPAGFVSSLKVTVTSATTPTGVQQLNINQRIEGTNIADLAWGTPDAKSVSLSFWVRSSLTGTFGGAFNNSEQTRFYPFTYTISVADTWEYKTITVAGDTSGTWLTDNGVGVRVFWSLGGGPDRLGTAGAWDAGNKTGATGQVQLLETAGSTFFITGVQLEAGAVATPFERRPFGAELAFCQRYFISYGGQQFFEPYGTGTVLTSTRASVQLGLPVPMRAPPSLVVVAPTSFTVHDGGGGFASTSLSFDTAGFQQIMYNADVASGLTVGRGVRVFSGSSLAPRIQLSSEI